ncbi:hypothetical protein FDP41_002481 [Naegleria fowleri]|uniref:Uncharacterized protein n=1 Tax=Naegleria fowleri TaxID=5763 RepID=A0A6A5BW37_NAEFO|nr:uncharacterized protein FDP41_002481 [Naegleria fowleri]KAF0978661.1 hypothetical protein FDP41_002481 [Naegleria fowleri]
MCLCGLPPDVILEAAHNAFKFWDNQRQVEIKYQEFLHKDTLSKASQMEKSYVEKLNDTKQKLQSVSERLQVTEEQYELTKREFQNIQEKYSEKVRERNKLQELYNSLKRKYEQSGGMRSTSPSLSSELESHTIVSPSSTYKENQENISPGNSNLLFNKNQPIRSSATSGLLDFRVSKTSPNNALAQNSSTSGVAALLKSSSNAGLNNTNNDHRSPLFALGSTNKNVNNINNGDTGKSYVEKLNDTKQKLQSVSERLQVTEEQYELTKREFQNIQEKYSEKVRERNKLQELYNSLKRKYEQSGGMRSTSPSLSSELESHTIVSPSSTYKENQENISPGNSNLLFNKNQPIRSSATSGLLDFRVSKTSPNNALAQNSSTSGVAALLKSSSNAGLNNTNNDHRSPLFALGSTNKNVNNINNGDTGKSSGFLFNRNEAHKLLYTPLKRSRPTSPRNPIQFNNALLPSRRSPTSK